MIVAAALGRQNTVAGYNVATNTLNINYATSGVTYAESNMRVNFGAASAHPVASLIVPKSSGKWVFEAVVISQVGNNSSFGFRNLSDLVAPSAANKLGGYSGDYAFLSNTGNKRSNNNSVAYASSWTQDNVISGLLDLDNGTISFAVDGVDQGIAFTGVSGFFVGCVCDYNNQQPNWRVSSTLTHTFAGYNQMR